MLNISGVRCSTTKKKKARLINFIKRNGPTLACSHARPIFASIYVSYTDIGAQGSNLSGELGIRFYTGRRGGRNEAGGNVEKEKGIIK